MSKIMDLIVSHEGVRYLPYKDSLGIQTIGAGHNLTKPLSSGAVMLILADDIADARHDCYTFDWFPYLGSVRQAVVIDMIFNMGLARFKGFKNTISHLARGTYSAAALEMLDSKWATQVGKRALELSNMMRTGEWQ